MRTQSTLFFIKTSECLDLSYYTVYTFFDGKEDQNKRNVPSLHFGDTLLSYLSDLDNTGLEFDFVVHVKGEGSVLCELENITGQGKLKHGAQSSLLEICSSPKVAKSLREVMRAHSLEVREFKV